nr:Z1 domain-containing protein [uncultured Novosphingobium sp.]
MAVDLSRMRRAASVCGRYKKQLERLRDSVGSTASVEAAVDGVLGNMRNANRVSLAVYGDPQSGKTEMMIALTAKLLDEGHRTIVHLMNDNVDLLSQNLGRFRASSIAPMPVGSTQFLASTASDAMQEVVVFCKKNAKDLSKLLDGLTGRSGVVVIDDEADYATPNGKVNKGTKTRINGQVEQLVGADGHYIGVTATPARLDLNRTMDNDTEKWVRFPAHAAYTGPEIFFPMDRKVGYRLRKLPVGEDPERSIVDAVLRFLVTSAFLNVSGERPQCYSMLIHTSGRRDQHMIDREIVESVATVLRDPSLPGFDDLATRLLGFAMELYGEADPNEIGEFVIGNASLIQPLVLNSQRDRNALGDSPTEPRSPFTIIVGGNIVSRGVTFPNLLAMLFTRDVTTRLQQDTYIQRARMFGARGSYLRHFELTIPGSLYADWHRCFVFHKLAYESIDSEIGSPVWIGDSRIAVTATTSINRATVSVDAGEMGFSIFDWDSSFDDIVASGVSSTIALRVLQNAVGKPALPDFVVSFMETMIGLRGGALAIHRSRDISGWSAETDKHSITRRRGFMGTNQIRPDKHQNAVHHIMIVRDGPRKARLFYKYLGDVEFLRGEVPQPN